MSVACVHILFQSRIWQKPCTKAKCLLRPALAVLEKTGFDFPCKRQGPDCQNKIYVKVPPEYLVQIGIEIFPLIQTETYPSDGQETVSL